MATLTMTFPRLHKAQWTIVSHPARFKIAACGRRFGKTEGGALLGTEAALHNQIVWWIGPTYRAAEFGWTAFKRIGRQIPGCTVRESERRVLYPGGGSVEVRSGDNPDNLRGAGLDLAILDEAAFMPPDVWSDAIRPALTDRRGRALFLSTPNGRNWFWQLWLQGQGARDDWKSWRFPSSANPHLSPDEIEAARELLPERIFAQEYGAEFLEDQGAVFRNVEACATAVAPDGPEDGHSYVMGVDWGREDDFTALAVIDTTTRRQVALDHFREIGWSLQRARLAALAEAWHVTHILAEANSMGGPNVEALQADGLPIEVFTTTAQSKGPLIESLALAFERSEIAILPDALQTGELLAYTMDRLPSGRYQYSAPAGLHDDTVIALALAWQAAQGSGIGLRWIA